MAALSTLSVTATTTQIIAAFNRLLARLNGPMNLPAYTVATRPTAASYTGAVIYVSDAAAGNKLQYSDGSTWVVAG